MMIFGNDFEKDLVSEANRLHMWDPACLQFCEGSATSVSRRKWGTGNLPSGHLKWT